MSETGKGCQYFKSFPSVLKIVEFVVLLIAIGTVGYFYNEIHTVQRRDTLKFFLFAVIGAWILVILFFFTFLSGLHQKMTFINWPLTVVLVFSIWAILLLVSSALLADAIRYYEDRSFCTLLDYVNNTAQCEHLITGAVCGFIATVLFIADVILHFGSCTVSCRTVTVEN